MAGFQQNVTTQIDTGRPSSAPSPQNPYGNVARNLGQMANLYSSYKEGQKETEDDENRVIGDSIATTYNEMVEMIGAAKAGKWRENEFLRYEGTKRVDIKGYTAKSLGVKSTLAQDRNYEDQIDSERKSAYASTGEMGMGIMQSMYPEARLDFESLNDYAQDEVMAAVRQRQLKDYRVVQAEKERLALQKESDKKNSAKGVNNVATYFDNFDPSGRVESMSDALAWGVSQLSDEERAATGGTFNDRKAIYKRSAQKFLLKIDDDVSRTNYKYLSDEDWEIVKNRKDIEKENIRSQIEWMETQTEDSLKQYFEQQEVAKKMYSAKLGKLMPFINFAKENWGDSVANNIFNGAMSENKPLYIMMKKVTGGEISTAFDALLTAEQKLVYGYAMTATLGSKNITDYSKDEQDKVAATHWATAEVIVNSEDMPTSDEGLAKVALGVVNVMDFAQDRGNTKDKAHMTTLLNSGGINRLYDALHKQPELQDRLAKKIVQYNASTIDAQVSKVQGDLDTRGGKKLMYDVKARSFIITKGEDITVSLGDGTSTTISGENNQIDKDNIIKLNKVVAGTNIYSKHDPALASMSPEKITSFLIQQGGVPTVNGTLVPITDNEKQAVDEGMSLEEFEKKISVEEQMKSYDKKTKEMQDAVLLPDSATKGAIDLQAALASAKTPEEAADIARQLWEQQNAKP